MAEEVPLYRPIYYNIAALSFERCRECGAKIMWNSHNQKFAVRKCRNFLKSHDLKNDFQLLGKFKFRSNESWRKVTDKWREELCVKFPRKQKESLYQCVTTIDLTPNDARVIRKKWTCSATILYEDEEEKRTSSTSVFES